MPSVAGMNANQLKHLIREVPDFPRPGILFYDITTLLKDPRGLRGTIDALRAHYVGAQVDTVIGIESRGFLVAAPLAYLLGNDFERVTVEKIDVSINSYETTQRARLERCWLDRKGPLKAGMSVPLRLLMRTYRGESFSETIPVSIPANARAGSYSLLVADAATLTSLEQREMRQPFVPKDLDQLIRAINSLKRTSHIYARLLHSDEGAIVSGEYLQSLPPSVLSVLGAGDQGSPVIPIRTTSVWDFDLPTRYAFTGSRSLTVTLER